MTSEIHKGDIGTVFRVHVRDGSDAAPLSNHTVKYFFTKPPNHDTVYEKTGTITSEESGIVQYVAESGFLDTQGQWQYQIQVTSGSKQWNSDITKFHVHRNVNG